MAKVNNYIFIMTADGREATGGSGKLEEITKLKIISEARRLYGIWRADCDNLPCSKCRFDAEGGKDCFLQYLDELEGKLNEGKI